MMNYIVLNIICNIYKCHQRNPGVVIIIDGVGKTLVLYRSSVECTREPHEKHLPKPKRIHRRNIN